MDKFDFLALLDVPPASIEALRAKAAGVCVKGSGSDDLDAPAGGAGATLPQPMQPDCKIVLGKVPGPINHVLCVTHGHIVDTAAHMIIAPSLNAYKKSAATKSAAAKTAQNAAAKAKQEQATAEKQHGDLEQKRGNKQLDVSLMVNGVYGPKDGLQISINAQPDHGEHTGEIGVAIFKARGGGLYVAPHSWLPPGGFMEFNIVSDGKPRVTFKSLYFTFPTNGLLRLQATERAKTSTVSSGRTIDSNYSQAGTASSTVGGIGGSATWGTGGGIADNTGISDTVTEQTGEYDVTIV